MGKRSCHLQLYIDHLLYFFTFRFALCPGVWKYFSQFCSYSLSGCSFSLTFAITCHVHIPTVTICSRLMTYMLCRSSSFYLFFPVVQVCFFLSAFPNSQVNRLFGFSPRFYQALNVCGSAGVSKPMGTLLYTMTSRLKDPNRLGFLTDNIAHSKIITEQQLTGTPPCNTFVTY